MEHIIKLAGKLPKGDPNGFDDILLAEQIGEAKRLHGRGGMYVAVVVYDVSNADVGDNSTVTVKARPRYVQPVLTEDGRQAVETVLRDEYRAQRGVPMPYEVEAVAKAAFADLPRSPAELDEIEERERERMSPVDELRMHLKRVHGRGDDIDGMTDAEVEHRHAADHDGDLPEQLAHDRTWIGWTRADLEAAEAESDDEPDDGELPVAPVAFSTGSDLPVD